MKLHKGFREPGELGPKQPGSREHDAKKSMEQGAEESNSNLGSMEHRILELPLSVPALSLFLFFGAPPIVF